MDYVNDGSQYYTSPQQSILILSFHLCLGLPSGLFPLCFTTKTLYASLLSITLATCPAHLVPIDLITRIIFDKESRPQSYPLCSLFHSLVTLTFQSLTIFLGTLFSNALNSCSSLSVGDQVSHQLKKKKTQQQQHTKL